MLSKLSQERSWQILYSKLQWQLTENLKPNFIYIYIFYFLGSKKKWEIQGFLIVKPETMNDLRYCLVKMLAFRIFLHILPESLNLFIKEQTFYLLTEQLGSAGSPMPQFPMWQQDEWLMYLHEQLGLHHRNNKIMRIGAYTGQPV